MTQETRPNSARRARRSDVDTPFIYEVLPDVKGRPNRIYLLITQPSLLRGKWHQLITTLNCLLVFENKVLELQRVKVALGIAVAVCWQHLNFEFIQWTVSSTDANGLLSR